MMTPEKLQNILEAVLLSADHPMTVPQLDDIFAADEDRPTRDEIRKALHDLAELYESRGFELKQVASGFRIQVKQDYSQWVGRLWEEKPARYTRALLETLALIAYRQPVTRGEIEEVRGVSVSSNIIRTLEEREWIKVLGHKDVPGKPALYGTTKQFLDYFNIKSLDDLPTLAEIKDLDQIYPELALEEQAANEAEAPGQGEESKDENHVEGEAEAKVDAEVETGVETAGADEIVAEEEHVAADVIKEEVEASAEVAVELDEALEDTLEEAEDALDSVEPDAVNA